VYRMFDVISPWSVGRYATQTGSDAYTETVTKPNLEELNSLGIDYMPVVFPGFSWSYRSIQEGVEYEFNQIPRKGGTFLWRQMYNAVQAFRQSDNTPGQQLYVAMFDEVDEATAIFKLAKTRADVPINTNFVTLDVDEGYSNVPSDWYLQLVGAATTLLRDSAADFPSEMPALPPGNELGGRSDEDPEEAAAIEANLPDSSYFDEYLE